MPGDIPFDTGDFEVYEDYEEYVDRDEHKQARAYERRRIIREEYERECREDFLDEYRYGVDSGEAGEEVDSF